MLPSRPFINRSTRFRLGIDVNIERPRWRPGGEAIGNPSTSVRRGSAGNSSHGVTGAYQADARRRLALLLIGGSLLAIDISMWLYARTYGFEIPAPGVDLRLYVGAAANWAATGGWVWPYQLAGPYEVWSAYPLPILYPPPMIPLFLVFGVIPAALWWVIPICATFAVVAHHRPDPHAWPLLLGLLIFPGTLQVIWVGNPTMWIVLGIALATIWPAAGPWALLKLTLAPFALVGIRRRGWWIGLVAFGIWCLPWIGMLPDYLTALSNARVHAPLLYSAPQALACLIPLAASSAAMRKPNPHLVPAGVNRANVQPDS